MLTRADFTARQNAALQHIKRTPKSAIWMGMGGGKTGVTLTAFKDALEAYESRRMLVSAPKRVARDVWHAEIDEWAHLQGLTVSRIVGSRQQRLDALRVPADIHTINREQLAWLFSGYVEEHAPSRFRQIRQWPWDWLTLDESQSYRNPGAQRTKAVHRISTFGMVQRILELTGTPAPKGYAQLWAQIYALDHGRRLGASEDAYLQRWFDPPEYGQGNPSLKGDWAKQEIQALLADIVLSLPDDGNPVPLNPIKVNLPPGAMRDYRKLERVKLLELDPHTITAVNAGVLGQKLLQLASGAIYVDDKRNYHTLHSVKQERLYEVLEEMAFSGPVAIAYGFIHELERMEKIVARYFGKKGRWARLKTEAELKAFERGELDVGLIHPASGGHGLNSLYKGGCQDIVWFGPTNDLELWDQLNARIAGGHRRGKNCRIHVLLARGTVDEDYLQMLHDKNFDQVGLMKAKCLQAHRAV